METYACYDVVTGATDALGSTMDYEVNADGQVVRKTLHFRLSDHGDRPLPMTIPAIHLVRSTTLESENIYMSLIITKMNVSDSKLSEKMLWVRAKRLQLHCQDY